MQNNKSNFVDAFTTAWHGDGVRFEGNELEADYYTTDFPTIPEATATIVTP